MSNRERTPEEWNERFQARTDRKVQRASDGLKRIELARRRLPEAIYGWACERVRFEMRPSGYVGLDLGVLIRLATDERMRMVWKVFSVPRVEPHKALEYFQVAVSAADNWRYVNSLIAEKRWIEKVVDLCGRLGSLLEEAPHSIYGRAFNILRIAACAEYRKQCGKVLPLDHPFVNEILKNWPTRAGDETFMWGDEAVETVDQNEFTLLPRVIFIEVHAPSLEDCLREVGDDFCRALEAHRQLLPRKITQTSACRTYVIRRLSKFMRQVIGKPYHEHVATTVMVALDLPGSQCLDGDFVRKMTADL